MSNDALQHWRTMAECGHNGSYSVRWEFDGVQHRITYGTQRRYYYNDIEACHEYGECVRHSLECAGIFNLENFT